MARALIVGCGYVGGALGTRLLAQGHEVFGLRRNPSALPPGVIGLAGDVGEVEGVGALPEALDWVVYAVGAKQRDEASYRTAYLDGLGRVIRALIEEGQNPSRVLFTSSTSVYGQMRGEWVDESSPTHPRSFAGEIMLSAERLLHGSQFSSTVLRLGGIYGPGRTRLIDRVRGGEAMAVADAPAYTNRIHRDDAAKAIAHLLALPEPGATYVGVDEDPADAAEVRRWIAERLGVALVEAPSSESLSVGRPVGSRRCRSAALLATGFRFDYPTFREGYATLMEAGDPEAI
jgi:nucleoside-diphosphate-sugar epimerase